MSKEATRPGGHRGGRGGKAVKSAESVRISRPVGAAILQLKAMRYWNGICRRDLVQMGFGRRKTFAILK